MSEVYLGYHPGTGERRAVKILQKRAGSAAKTYARFLREVEIMQKLDHPNIVRVIEAGTLEDCYYYMMEYLAGGSLAQKHGRSGVAANGGVYLLFEKVLQAMAYAHEKGIIHRDLKPANILLRASAEPAISDFGIAKILDADVSLTRSTEVCSGGGSLRGNHGFSTAWEFPLAGGVRQGLPIPTPGIAPEMSRPESGRSL